MPLRGRHLRFEDTIATLRQALASPEGLVTGGETVPYPGMSVSPKPAQAGGPPIWIGGVDRAGGKRRAGRIGRRLHRNWGSPQTFARAEYGLGAGVRVSSAAGALRTGSTSSRQCCRSSRLRRARRRGSVSAMLSTTTTGNRGRGSSPAPGRAHPQLRHRSRQSGGRSCGRGPFSGTRGTRSGIPRALTATWRAMDFTHRRVLLAGLDPALRDESMAAFAERVAPQLRSA